ncbi:MAG: site-specific integrase [Verrucomicrobia bacterium]|nr:site-specific integrase [Verrucomicrobiota bacterium]
MANMVAKLPGMAMVVRMKARKTNDLEKWEYPPKSGIWIREFLYIQTFEGNQKTYSAYQVTVPGKVYGKAYTRKRRQFPTKAKAQKWANEVVLGLKLQGEVFFKATEEERQEFAACMPKLRDKGLTLTEAVNFALERLKPKGGEKTIGEITEELIESKRIRFDREDLRPRSFKDFRNRTSKFASDFNKTPIYDLTVEELKTWLIALDVSPRTTFNYLSVISEVLKYAVQKGYLSISPVNELTDNDRKELCGSLTKEQEPCILTIEEARRLLDAARDNPDLELLGMVTLGLFCGIRVEELKRLKWEDVHDDEENPVVTISGTIAKKRRIRHVDIPENAVQWLSLCADRSGTVAKNRYITEHDKRFRKLLKLAGFGHEDENGVWKSSWDNNAMRHSFGSYHYALTGDPLETARQLGHKASDQVLFDHYRALAKKSDGEKYFAIKPAASAAKILEFAR